MMSTTVPSNPDRSQPTAARLALGRIGRRWPWLMAGLSAGILLWAGREEVGALLVLLADPEAVRNYVRALGVWGPLLLALLQVIQILVAVIPGQAILVASGYIYGFGVGLAFNVLTTLVASQVAFAAARAAGRPLVGRFVPAQTLDRFDALIERHGALFFVVNFLIPVIPGDVLNLVAGLSTLTAGRFFWVNLWGRLPGLVVMTLIGSHGVALPPSIWIGAVVVASVLLLGTSAWHLGRTVGWYAQSRAQA